jgi:hypothetical protein
MSSNVLLCSTEFLKDNISINHEIDSNLLEPAILLAGDKYIMPILGSTLYNKILDDVRSATISGNYSALTATYIRPALMHWAVYEVLPFINLRVTNINVGKKSNESTEPATLEELNFIARREFDTAAFYSERLTRYLVANSSLFPEYLNYQAGADTIAPSPTQYFNGLHIPSFFPYAGGTTFGQMFANSVQYRAWLTGLAARTPWTF